MLESQAAIWGMHHFLTSLKGCPFSLYSDQHLASKLGKDYMKTVHHLLEACRPMTLKPSSASTSNCPLISSQNTVHAISWEP
jgi:hypothetical protein